MRRARSQLNKLMNQGANDYGNGQNGNSGMNGFAINHEAAEIQRRLDSMQYQQQQHQSQQQPMMYHGQPNFEDSAYGGVFQQPIPQAMQNNMHNPAMYNPAMHNPVMQQQPMMANNAFNQQAPQQMQTSPQPYTQPHQQFNPMQAHVTPMQAHANPQPMQHNNMESVDAYMGSIAPAPASHNAGGQQLDTIKKSLEQMSSKLQSMNQVSSSNNAAQTNNMQQVEVLKQHYSQINGELQGIKNTLGSLANADNSNGDIQIIRETLNANYHAIMEQLEKAPNAQIDSSVFSQALDASHNELANQIADLKSSISSISTMPDNADIYAKTLEVSHDDITKRLDEMHNALQVTIAQPGMYVDKLDTANRDLQNQIQTLQDAVDNIETGKAETPEADFSNIEMRLEEITRAVVALSLNDTSVNNLERIEARVSDVSKALEDMSKVSSKEPEFDYSGFEKLDSKLSDIAKLMHAGSPDLNGITTQINSLSEKFENFSALATTTPVGMETFTAHASHDNSALLARMDDLVDQIGKTQAAPTHVNDNAEVLDHLEKIAGAIDQLSAPAAMPVNTAHDANQLSEIEKQLIQISKQMSLSSVGQEISFDPITDRLSGIEEQLGASRDITIELATKAAENAVKMTMSSAPQFAAPLSNEVNSSPAILESMSKALEQLNEQSEVASSQNVQALGAVSETLNLMVERIGNLETGLLNKSNEQYSPLPTASNFIAENVVQNEYVEPQEALLNTVVEGVESAGNSSTSPEDFSQSTVMDTVTDTVMDQTQDELSSPAQALVMAARAAENASDNAEIASQSAISTAILKEPIANNIELDQQFDTAVDYKGVDLPEMNAPNMSLDTMPDIQETDISNTADVPLEPGTGGPDLAALVRQANERRKNNKGASADSAGTDFIAAARRAAQAAAQEASSVEEEIEEKTSKSLFSALPDLFLKRKKVIIMAAAAALFVALAVPLAAKFFGGEEKQVSSLNNNVTIEQPLSNVADQDVNIAAVNTPVIAVAPESEQPANNPSVDLATPIVNDEVAQQVENVDDVNIASIDVSAPPEVTPTPTNFAEFEGLEFAPEALRQAVQQGEPAAIFEIGKRYTDGNGVKKDLSKAAEWYERAANLGFAPAQYIIGNFNEKGLGVDKNAFEASEWYEKAAKGGNIVAMHNLAVLSATPNALTPEPDMNAAFKWFSNAADYGVRDSQVNAGIFHTKGFGTEVNLVEAYKWFAIAAKAGDKDASNKRDLIANAIPPSDLEVAKALVQDWKPLDVVKAANEVTVKDAWKSAQQTAAIKLDRNTIAQTQILLSKVGFNAGTPDGIMGQKTRNAIAAFQQKVGLPVNGKIDLEFIKALKEVAI